MENLIHPNIHPVLVHFAYGLTFTSALAYALAFLRGVRTGGSGLLTAANWMLAFAVLFIALTIAAGFQAYYTVDHDGPSHEAMTTHRNWALGTASAVLSLALWRWVGRKSPPGLPYVFAMVLAAGLISVTGWWGGSVVYKHGIGVERLPAISGEGHDHDHGDEGHDHGDEEAKSTSSAEIPSPEAGSPAAVVEAFAAALKAGDAAALEALVHPDILIAESGGVERSFAEYAGHHMPADMEFMGAVDITLKNRTVLEVGGMASVISESQLHGTIDGKTIHARMMETMVLTPSEQGWRIAHIHWSSAPLTDDHDH